VKRFVSLLLLLSMIFTSACSKKPDPVTYEPRLHVVNPTEVQLKKCSEDTKAGTVTLLQGKEMVNGPVIDFLHRGEVLDSEAWAISGTIKMTLSAGSGSASFRCWSDDKNYAEFILDRSVSGTEVLRYIVREGVRLQESLNEIVTNTLQDGRDWTAKFSMIFCDGFVYLYLQEDGEAMKLITSYGVDWEHCRPRFEVTKNADVEFSALQTLTDPDQVRQYYREISVPGEILGTKRLLFLGNSGIFYYDMPNTFSRLARQAGYLVEVNTIAQSSAALYWFTDPEKYVRTLMQEELQKDYDLVLIQPQNGVIYDTSNRTRADKNARQLVQEIRDAGLEPWFYVRPPRYTNSDGSDPSQAAWAVDTLFEPLGRELDVTCTYVNRAYALAYQTTDIHLWYKDQIHSNNKGAYLAACVMFSTLFNTSCQVLGDDDLPAEEALALRTIADQVVLEGKLPW